VSMGWTAVRKLREVVANVRTCLAVEVCCAAQGVDLRTEIAVPSEPLRAVHAAIRKRVPAMNVDREVSEQIIAVDELLPMLVDVAATRCGGLR
jgi:histidine ammonia-lyase